MRHGRAHVDVCTGTIALQNDEFCIKNDGMCIKNPTFCNYAQVSPGQKSSAFSVRLKNNTGFQLAVRNNEAFCIEKRGISYLKRGNLY